MTKPIKVGDKCPCCKRKIVRSKDLAAVNNSPKPMRFLLEDYLETRGIDPGPGHYMP